MAINDITGDTIISGSPTEAYRQGYDNIWGKKPAQDMPQTIGEMVEQETQEEKPSEDT